MKFIRLIQMFLLTCVVSMYVFPIEFKFLPPGLNTKMILGVVGIIAYAFHAIVVKSAYFRKTTIVSLLFALVFSVWCFYSMVANGTPDDSYASYYMSFAVWLGGAYAVTSLIKGFHGRVNLALLVQYMTFVCVAQCILALLIDSYPGFRNFVDSFVVQGQEFMQRVRRLYGIGAALDPAGCRFSVVLVLLAHFISSDKRVADNRLQLILAISTFLVITLIGNMISRTTTAGAALGLGYMFLRLGTTKRGILSGRKLRFYGTFLWILAIVVVYSTIKYNIDPSFRSNLRFAFEGFFSFFETGEFKTSSTDKLQSVMWIWPDTVRDWIIGTGWFGFYVYATDIGYCRFVLYCGLVGFSLFVAFFLYNASVVWRKFRDFKFATFLLVVLMFAIWVKVATDIFWIYALMFCLPDDDDGTEAVTVESRE